MAEHQFHFRFGPDDLAAQTTEAGGAVTEIPLLPNQHNLGHCLGATLNGLADLGLSPSELGVDFLLLGAAVLTADKHVSRKYQAEDSWTRELAVSLAVSEPDRWNAVASELAKALGFLSGDRWRFIFRPRPPAFAFLARRPKQARVQVDRISLLSGGLDSFIGAIDILEAGHRALFVSHSAVGSDSGRQRSLLQALGAQYGDHALHLRGSIQVGKEHVRGTIGENSERSRSFLFFSLAALAATALPEVDTIVVPENGLISLNIPLEELRLGSLSTRTTHPYFLARMNELLAALGFGAKLSNPYQFCTKGEMVRDCRNRGLLIAGLARTISCSSPNSSRIRFGEDQCGYCMPCLIRRAAFANNVVPDTTAYGIRDLKANVLRSDKKPGEHVRAFQAAILRLDNNPARAGIIVHESGTLNDHPDRYSDFADMYRRGLQEVAALLNGVISRPHA
jgi:7-cyano-7-deazaguanine synthase in queuosine biosynthesis